MKTNSHINKSILTRVLIGIFLLSSLAYGAENGGLLGEYYNNLNWSGEPKRQTDKQINFKNTQDTHTEPTTHKADTVVKDIINKTVLWEGYLQTTSEKGEYRICASYDDGIEVWLNEKKVIDRPNNNQSTYYDGEAIPLEANTPYKIRVKYKAGRGANHLMLGWLKPSQPKGNHTYPCHDYANNGNILIPESNLIPLSKPVHEYRFDECELPENKIIKDSAENNEVNATAKNGAKLNRKGLMFGAAEFDGKKSYINLNDPLANLFNKSYSVSLWFKPTEQTNNGLILFKRGIFELRIQNNMLQFAKAHSGWYDLGTVKQNQWNFLMVSYNLAGDNQTLVRFNDSAMKPTRLNTAPDTSLLNNPIYIGGDDSTDQNRHFKGYIDELKFYDYDLARANLNSIYENEKTGKTHDGSYRESLGCGVCKKYDLKNGFHLVNPYVEKTTPFVFTKRFEVFCYNKRDFIALPNKNAYNNFAFKSETLSQDNYYQNAQESYNAGKDFHGIEVEISEGNENNPLPEINLVRQLHADSKQYINGRGRSNFKAMGHSFSNINLIGTPFAIDWANTNISDCDESKLRKGYFGQTVKINTLAGQYTNARCKINNMKFKLLDDYYYVKYNKEVLEISCKELIDELPDNDADGNNIFQRAGSPFGSRKEIRGHFWVDPRERTRNYGGFLKDSAQRPFVAYCKYETDIPVSSDYPDAKPCTSSPTSYCTDYGWTFLLALDGKRTFQKEDLETNANGISKNTCGDFGLAPFVPNSEYTFERVREYLANNKEQMWRNYTGTLGEKIKTITGKGYYKPHESNTAIWPYGSFGVFYPDKKTADLLGTHWKGTADSNGNIIGWDDDGGSTTTAGYMSGSPMHNIKYITEDYDKIEARDVDGNLRVGKSGVRKDKLITYYGAKPFKTAFRHSLADTNGNDNSYPYEATMGAKGWISVLALPSTPQAFRTNDWFISRTGAAFNIDDAQYYEPTGNYRVNKWLNFLFDQNGRIRHLDDWADSGAPAGNKYPYYDYMCMSWDNYQVIKPWDLRKGPFTVIEADKPALTTKGETFTLEGKTCTVKKDGDFCHGMPVASKTERNRIERYNINTKIVNKKTEFKILLLNDGNQTHLDGYQEFGAGLFLAKCKGDGCNEKSTDDDIEKLSFLGELNKRSDDNKTLIHDFDVDRNSSTAIIKEKNWKFNPNNKIKDGIFPNAEPRLFFRFYYCDSKAFKKVPWTDCYDTTDIFHPVCKEKYSNGKPCEIDDIYCVCKTASSNDFAVRPDKFKLEFLDVNTKKPVDKTKAHKEYELSIKALQYDENTSARNPARDYNATKVPLILKENKQGCAQGNLKFKDANGNEQNLTNVDTNGNSVLNVDFEDGVSTINGKIVYYDEVGNINIKIKEQLGKEFALVDNNDSDFDSKWKDDPSGIDRQITPNDDNASFELDHFEVSSATIIDASKQKGLSSSITYLAPYASINDMNASIDVNITAKAYGDKKVKNYHDSCYSKNIDLNVKYEDINIPKTDTDQMALNKLYFISSHVGKNPSEDGEINAKVNGDFSLFNDAISISNINKNVFDENGSAKIQIAVNFDRNMTKSVNPFKFKLKKLHVQENSNPDVNGSKDISDQEASFFYGRVWAPSNNIFFGMGIVSARYEIFCDPNPKYGSPCLSTTYTLGEVNPINNRWLVNTNQKTPIGIITQPDNVSITADPPTGISDRDTAITTTVNRLEPNAIKGGFEENIQLIPTPDTAYVDIMGIAPSPWLLQNDFVEQKTNDFTVEFVFNNGGNWSGQGQLGDVVDESISTRVNRSMEW